MSKCEHCPNLIPAMRDQGHDCGFPECMGWTIEKNVKPISDRKHDWDFSHKDNDVGYGLCGTAESFEAAARKIMEIEEARTEGVSDET